MLVPIKQIIITEGLLDFLDGKSTVYHGTSKENKENILNNGLQGSYTGGDGTATEILKSINPKAFDESKNKVFTTNSRWAAAKYAASHNNGKRITGLSDQSDQQKAFLGAIKSYITGDGIVKMRVPKDFKNKNEILNPELKGLVDKNAQNPIAQQQPEFARNYILPTAGMSMFGDDRVFKKDIPSNFVVGSKDYNQSLNFNNIKSNLFGPKESKFTKLKNQALNGSTKSFRRGKSVARKIGAVNNILKTGAVGGVGYSLLPNDETIINQISHNI